MVESLRVYPVLSLKNKNRLQTDQVSPAEMDSRLSEALLQLLPESVAQWM